MLPSPSPPPGPMPPPPADEAVAEEVLSLLSKGAVDSVVSATLSGLLRPHLCGTKGLRGVAPFSRLLFPTPLLLTNTMINPNSSLYSSCSPGRRFGDLDRHILTCLNPSQRKELASFCLERSGPSIQGPALRTVTAPLPCFSPKWSRSWQPYLVRRGSAFTATWTTG